MKGADSRRLTVGGMLIRDIVVSGVPCKFAIEVLRLDVIFFYMQLRQRKFGKVGGGALEPSLTSQLGITHCARGVEPRFLTLKGTRQHLCPPTVDLRSPTALGAVLAVLARHALKRGRHDLI